MAYAKGIPDKRKFGDLRKLKAKEAIRYVLQQHYSARHKRDHYDLRLGTPDLGLYSWAIPKTRLPVGKEKLLAVRTPLHDYGYNNFTGVIPRGYGAGKVTMADRGSAIIHKVGPSSVEFSLGHQRQPTRYKLVKTGKRLWLIMNTTPKGVSIIGKKPKIVAISDKELSGILDRASNIQTKIDGAHTPVEITPKGKIEAYSIRTNSKNKPIIHTERLGLAKLRANVLKDTILRAEAYGEKQASIKQAVIKQVNGKYYLYTKDGKKILGRHKTRESAKKQEMAIQIAKLKKKADSVIPFHQISGILNSNPDRSLRTQRLNNIKMKLALLDIVRYKGKDVTGEPYKKRREILEHILNELPDSKFTLPTEIPKDQVSGALEAMHNKKHPQSNEGIVIDNKYKYVIRPTTTGYFKGTFSGKGKRSNTIGGITYSDKPKGPVVGKIGTGFTEKTLLDILSNKTKYNNRAFRFTHKGQNPSGNYREPSFDGWETDK